MTAVSPSPSLVVGVDVGGTFTDLFVLDERSGQARIVKVPSTRGEEARGFMNGIARIHGDSDATAAPQDAARAMATIVHGTTVGTNALLERRGARVALLATAGFGDEIEISQGTEIGRPSTLYARVDGSAEQLERVEVELRRQLVEQPAHSRWRVPDYLHSAHREHPGRSRAAPWSAARSIPS